MDFRAVKPSSLRLPGRSALSALLLLGLATPLSAITITEIMYHPKAADEAAIGEGRSLEWIEIYNESGSTHDLSGYRFINGIQFTFPRDTFIAGRSYLVVCADEDAVRAHYGITNTIGNFTGRLDNDGERIELAIFGGGTEVEVRYQDRSGWPHAGDGTGHSIALKGLYLDPDEDEHWVASPAPGGTPGGPNFDEPTVVETIIVDDDETWRYRKGTSAYPAGWNTNLDFNDGSWLSGRTGIGYSDGDDRTTLNDMSNGYWSFAARYEFTLSQEQFNALGDVALEISYDDGFAFWVNGVEVARAGLGAPRSTIRFDQSADSHEAAGFESFPFAKSRLQVGRNLLAGEVHNTSLGSSDSSFVPRIISIETIFPVEVELVPVAINEVQFRNPGQNFLELRNLSGGAVDLSGFTLSDDRTALGASDGAYVIAEGTTIPPYGELSFSETETGLDFDASDAALNYYLSRPGEGGAAGGVVTAELFEQEVAGEGPDLAGLSEARWPQGLGQDGALLGRFHATDTPTPSAPNEVSFEDRVVISEIFYHPPRGKEATEFLEIHNPSGTDVDLTGFRFTRGIDFEFVDGTILPAGGYLVIARDEGALAAAHPEVFPLTGPYEGGLSDNGELVRLVDPLGKVVDQVRYYDSGEWPKLADAGGSSLELRDPLADNSLPSAWGASDETQKAEWEEHDINSSYTSQSESEFQIRMLGAGECLVDSVSLTRSGVEYLRNGSFDSSTSSWRIQGNHGQSFRTTADTHQGAGALHIVATGDGDLRVNRIETDAARSMSSGTYRLQIAMRWLGGTDLIHLSAYRQPTNFQHSIWLQIPDNLGTPGAPNSIAVANLGPAIGEVRHAPPVPSAGQETRILARVADPDGVVRVTARYRTNSRAGSYSSRAMFDDGQHEDGEPGDGLYGGEIPGQSNGTRVVFYVEAEDTTGEVWQDPPEGVAKARVYLHDSPLTARGHRVRVIHDSGTWSELNSRPLHSNELLDGTFVFEESEVYYNVGTRYRGSPWNRPPNPKMYRVKFAKDQLHRGRTAVNLSRYGSGLSERAAYYSVWRNSTSTKASPMSRGSHARVRDGARTATLEIVDPVNRDYLKLWFPGDADGFLYKIQGKQLFDDSGNHQGGAIQWSNYQYRGSNKASYRWFFNPRTREDEDNWVELAQMMQKVNGSSSVLDNELEDIMDVEQFLRVYAARCAHDDWDTIAIGNGQNMYFYYAAEEGRFKLVPWDMDHSWGNVNARTLPDADNWFRNVINRPKYRRLYAGIIDEMLNGRPSRPGYWSAAEMVDKFLEPTHDEIGGDGVSGPGGIRNFINSRRGRLQGLIPSRVSFAVVTGDGRSVDSASTRITGNGWVDVWQILVNGEALELSWTSNTRWSATVPLEAGVNELDFFAFDVDGNFIDSDSITVTSTVGWASPEITAVSPEAAEPGTMVEIAGTEFHDGIRVFFGGEESSSVFFEEDVDATRVLAELPSIAPGEVEVVVENVDGRRSEPASLTVLEGPPQFVRGDANLDERVDLSDPLRVLGYLFGGLLLPCLDAGDTDDDEAITLSDAVALMNYLFLEGPAPAAPFPAQGWDGEGEELDCAEGFSAF